MPSVVNSIKVAIFYALLAFAAFIGLIFAQTPAIPLIFFSRRLYFRWCSKAMGSYLLMVTCLLEDMLGIRIVVTGDNLINDRKRSLILLNHRTRLDWMFIWMLQSRFQILDQLKIVLKAQLKHVPGPGWAMQHAAYLFLDRDWEKDQQTINSLTNYYHSAQSPLSLLIFPEGTNLTSHTKQRSNEYAAKQKEFNRPYDFTLHPRTTGFTYLLKTMRTKDILDAVDDVTIAYEGDFPKNELEMLKGRIPRAVHFNVKRYDVKDLPTTDDEAAKWLQTLWDEKENRLQKFYEKNSFDEPTKQINDAQVESTVRFQRRVAFAFWSLFILFWTYCIFAFIKLKFYVVLVCLFHLILDQFANGLIDFVCQLNENQLRRAPPRAIKQE